MLMNQSSNEACSSTSCTSLEMRIRFTLVIAEIQQMLHDVKLDGDKDEEAGLFYCDVTVPCKSESLVELDIFRFWWPQIT